MGGLLMLVALSLVMALASFLAGALPLSVTMSQSQLRLISSIGIGVLVGTSLIVIIPEGIEAVATTGVAVPAHAHGARSMFAPRISGISRDMQHSQGIAMLQGSQEVAKRDGGGVEVIDAIRADVLGAREDAPPSEGKKPVEGPKDQGDAQAGLELPTFDIGLSLVLGFVLMFLIDRLPQHASERMQAAPATRHISLDNLASSSVNGDEEADNFLGTFAPSPRQSRSLATTTGLVIHAAADGIAMGASATTTDTKLGFIIFVAIMIHKAPAAFGLTSVLLRQGLSKRAARGHLIVFSLAAPVGALATYVLVTLLGGGNMESEKGKWWTGMLLLFSAGTFLYVAMHSMEEEGTSQTHDHHSSMNGYANDGGPQRKQDRPQMRDTLLTVGGMLLPLLTQFGHHH